MDAIGAHAPEPDDRSKFDSIVANLKIVANLDTDEPGTEQADVAGPEPENEIAPAAPEAPQAPPPAPAPKADRERAAAPNPVPPPPPVTVPAPAQVVEPVPLAPLPQPVKPERPDLVKPTRPDPPQLGAAKNTGHYASLTGYIMSVGVGAFGQIMFLGTWLANMLPAPGNWIAAAIGAAFAEIGMIGAGNSSLTKRADGGRWKLLFGVACFVCAGAVTMQVAHWLPKGFGVALVFGLASFVGFLIHMTIEHSKIRDHEDRMANYEKAMKAFRAEEQARYEQDLAAYEAAVAEQQRQRRQIEQAAKKSAEPAEPPQPVAKPPAKPAGGRATKADALRIGVQHKARTPAKLRDALIEAGYGLPASSTTVENWCKDIKAQLDDNVH
ncbi:hypothetical protein DMC63_37985 [Streptomyces sp. WAC 05977]|nr:hypothetical protein DMC63_37985 [Streptomyces sp. WAC 05977]